MMASSCLQKRKNESTSGNERQQKKSVRLEAHIEHAICFIQHQKSATGKISHAAIAGTEHINHTSRSRNDNFTTCRSKKKMDNTQRDKKRDVDDSFFGVWGMRKKKKRAKQVVQNVNAGREEKKGIKGNENDSERKRWASA